MPPRYKETLAGHEVHFVPSVIGEKIRDHRMMEYAAANDFDVLITRDQNLRYQQPAGLPFSVVVLGSYQQDSQTMNALMERASEALPHLSPGEFCHIDAPEYAARRLVKAQETEVAFVAGNPGAALPIDKQAVVFDRCNVFTFEWPSEATAEKAECIAHIFEREGQQSLAVLTGIPDGADMDALREVVVPQLYDKVSEPEMGLLYTEHITGRPSLSALEYRVAPDEPDVLVCTDRGAIPPQEIEALILPHVLKTEAPFSQSQKEPLQKQELIHEL